MGATAVAERQTTRVVAPERRAIRPQPGPQELFASTPADIAIIGGSLFGGKTWSLVIEPLRHKHVKGFTFVAFRRQMPEHTNPGGMWNESEKWYPSAGGVPRVHLHDWRFYANGPNQPHTAEGKFAGLSMEKDLEDWKGAQITLLMFDQLETFVEKMFFVMLSRNRSTCGVRPYTRASCNPDPDSFLVQFLAWWIDEEGWAIPERSGVIRWFIRVHDDIVWSTTRCEPEEYDQYDARTIDARTELETKHPGQGDDALSVTFVLARLQDNLIGNTLDPDYARKARAMPSVEQKRLIGGDRGGNWKVRATAGTLFNRANFLIIGAKPTDVTQWVRYWDKAGTEGGGKWTAGVLIGRRPTGRFVIADVVRGQWGALNRETVIKQTAISDAQLGVAVDIWLEREPGSGGKESAEGTVLNLAGHYVRAESPTGDKVTRSRNLRVQVEAQNVDLVAGPWNEAFLKEAHSFDGVHGAMDQIDAASGAFNKLTLGLQPIRPVPLSGT